MTVAEIMEKDRVEKILADLRKGHTDEYRRELLVALFEAGELPPANTLPC